MAAVVLAATTLVMAQTPAPDPYRAVAEQYVKLVLAVGQHDGDFVDAFYGPAEWRREAEAAKKPLAVIDSQAAAVEAELIEYCRAHLARFKCPASIDFEAELPRLDTGKLYKRVLRDRYWGAP